MEISRIIVYAKGEILTRPRERQKYASNDLYARQRSAIMIQDGNHVAYVVNITNAIHLGISIPLLFGY